MVAAVGKAKGVEELVNKAVEEFDSCQKLAERLFPKVFAKEAEASTEKKD